jgi:uncharacterized membrane protein
MYLASSWAMELIWMQWQGEHFLLLAQNVIILLSQLCSIYEGHVLFSIINVSLPVLPDISIFTYICSFL